MLIDNIHFGEELTLRLALLSYSFQFADRGGIMVEYAYTNVNGKIKLLLEKIRTVGVPSKVSVSWLKSLGFTSSNDVSLLGVIKFIKLTDQSGTPSATWSAFRGRNHKTVLGEAIRNGYAELYAVYPEAHLCSSAELTHVFNTSSSAGSQVIQRTVATFRALVDEAEFSVVTIPTETKIPSGPLHNPPAGVAPQVHEPVQGQYGPALHIDIQIHISAESTPQQIDKIFESMAKNLYGRKDG